MNNQGNSEGRGDAIKRLPVSQTTSTPTVEVRSKYSDLSAVDMAFMHTWLSRSGQWSPSTAFLRELAYKAFRAVERGDLDAGALHALPIKADELMHTENTGYGSDKN